MPHFESEEEVNDMLMVQKVSYFSNFWDGLKFFWRTCVLVPWWQFNMERRLSKNEEVFDKAIQDAMKAKLEEYAEEQDELMQMEFALSAAQFTIDNLSDENTHLKNLLGQALDKGFKFTDPD